MVLQKASLWKPSIGTFIFEWHIALKKAYCQLLVLWNDMVLDFPCLKHMTNSYMCRCECLCLHVSLQKFPSQISRNVSQSVFLSDQRTGFIRTIWADSWSVIVFIKLMKLWKIRYKVFYGPWGSWESRTDRKLCTQHSPTDLSLSSQCLELLSRLGTRFQKKLVWLFSCFLNRKYLLPHLALS